MIGVDMDGVYSDGFRPDDKNFIIVTGRHVSEFSRTIEQVGPNIPVYMRPFGGDGDVHAAGLWKAHIINLAELTEFYEDNPLQVTIIKHFCPDCVVHKVVSGKYVGIW